MTPSPHHPVGRSPCMADVYDPVLARGSRWPCTRSRNMASGGSEAAGVAAGSLLSISNTGWSRCVARRNARRPHVTCVSGATLKWVNASAGLCSRGRRAAGTGRRPDTWRAEGELRPRSFYRFPRLFHAVSPPVQTNGDSRHRLTIPGNAGIPWSREHGLKVGTDDATDPARRSPLQTAVLLLAFPCFTNPLIHPWAR